METITLSIPKELKKLMGTMPEVKWSEVFRNIIINKVQQLEKFEEMSKKGKI